jgi:hypothetical protein
MITIFMLTKDDVTIPEADAVYAEVAAAFSPEELPYVGFKNIGHPLEDLRALGAKIVGDGRRLVIEIVGSSAASECEAAELAVELGADLLIGGTHTGAVLPVIAGSAVRYHPTVGDPAAEAGRLHGSLEGIASEAAELLDTVGVAGVMLLGYRYAGDVPALLDTVAGIPGLRVVNAGSVDSRERIRALAELGYWAFTIGSAVLDRSLPAGPTLADQLHWVIETAA